MPATLHVISEIGGALQNDYVDALLVIRAIMAFDSDAAPTEASIVAFAVSPHRFIHSEETEPTDIAQPEETVVMWSDFSPPSSVMFKAKDSGGVVKSGRVILT